jgi:hypothetical protein
MSVDALGSEDTLVGQLFADRYRIEARLGEGGMGTVYRAHHTGLDCKVAVKLLHPSLTSDPVIARRFDREALALSKLDHPNCLRVLDAGTSPAGAKYIVMPLLAGHELRALLEEPLPLARAIDFVTQILRGLEHAHRRGLIHRDLKPENVLVVKDDEGREVVKLVDFGIVKLLVEDAGVEPLTRVGLVFGTPRYMSPEQVSGGKISERTDLYAVGIILFELLTGSAPFEADDAGMLMLMRMQILGDVPPLPDTVPTPVAEVVHRLLEKTPSDRYASAREVREALESAMLAAPGRTVVAATGTDPLGATIGAAPLPAPAVMTPAPVVMALAPAVAPPLTARSDRAIGRYAVLGAALALALVGLTIVFVMQETSPPPPSGSATSTVPAAAAMPAAMPAAPPPPVVESPTPAPAPERAETPSRPATPRTTTPRKSPPRDRDHGKGHGNHKGDKKKKGKFGKGGFGFEID